MNFNANVSPNPESMLTGMGGSMVANLMASGFNVNALRTNGLLQKDEWVQLDTTVVSVARKRLNGIADLQSRGLTYNLGGLGVLTSEWENQSSMTDADVDMGAEVASSEDSVAFTTQGVPVPIIHKGYRMNIRRLMASRRMGQGVDVIQAAEATRKVVLQLENILFNGFSLKNDGYNVYGYTTFPNRLTTNISTAWDESTPDIIGDVTNMINTAAEAGYYGPFMLYVPSNYWAVMQEDYDTYKDGTWYDRLLRIRELEDIKVSDVISSTECVLVQMTPDVVDLAIGQDITNVEWNTMGGLVQHMKIMGAMVPRIKYAENEDGDTVSGIVHAFETVSSTTTT